MFTKIIVGIIHDICKVNHYAVHCKQTVLDVNYISVKLKEKKEKHT